jgi:EAL domain-containing protein (putative c-di-GMP-specific phosphodiesterase class I)
MDLPKHPFFDECDFTLVGQHVYCPVDLHADRLVEVLTRPSRGTNGSYKSLNPQAFFEQLETDIEASIQYDLWVLGRVQQFSQHNSYLVNLSANTLLHQGLLYYLNRCQYHFHFEISERHQGIYSDDALHLIYLLSKRHSFYLDDFGVGSANLLNLELLAPYLSGVKIDASLVLRIGETSDQKIVGNLFRMLDELGLIAIAEGVETLSHHIALTELRNAVAPNLHLCFQGWLWGKPTKIYPFEPMDDANII